MKFFTEESGTTLYKIFEERNDIKSNKIKKELKVKIGKRRKKFEKMNRGDQINRTSISSPLS